MITLVWIKDTEKLPEFDEMCQLLGEQIKLGKATGFKLERLTANAKIHSKEKSASPFEMSLMAASKEFLEFAKSLEDSSRVLKKLDAPGFHSRSTRT